MRRLNSNAVLLLAMSIVLSACAQLFMKASMLELKVHDVSNIDISILWLVIENNTVFVWLLAGLVCYAVSMLSWMFALIKYELSFAYPFLGLTYILVYLGAIYWAQIGEHFSWQRTAGILLILVGVAFVNGRFVNDKFVNGQVAVKNGPAEEGE